ncbi:MAG: hypothetical protein QUT27_06270, partial [candidate division Zixibacteria bacterium]|nr:hypothetical protein [candidate division Zixibacteria bacterium]
IYTVRNSSAASDVYKRQVLLLAPAAAAQPPPTPPRAQAEPPAPAYPEQFFLHAGVGGGLAVFSSGDIERRLSDEFHESFKLTNAGVDFAYLVRCGYRNIAQAEYRVEKGFGHKFYYDLGTASTASTDRVEVEANVDSWEWLLKINPAFTWLRDKSMGIYLLYGRGTSEYFGDLGVQFDGGEKELFGIEFLKLYRWYAFTVSAEYHTITYDSYADEDSRPTAGAWDASYWIIQGSLSAGFGD